jgi:primosomal protein N' (replication factor Y)
MTDGTTDILVGTQMVTKGLDLDHVTLVGIMNADALINFPDFRATERAFQLMAQVAGRAGRRKKKGAVIIQTYDPFQHVIELVKEHNTEQLYLAEIEERRQYFYPPFSRLIRLTVKHRNETKANACAHAIQARLEPLFGARVLGPETPYISRIRNMHLRNVLIKLKKGQYRNEKAFAKKQIEDVLALERFRSVRVVIDVDPN